jgi:DNA-directed RNA polymerase specialized sigma24 family protein
MTSPLDTADLAAFCRAQYAGLVRALSLYCGDRDVAQELAQETIAIACRDWSKVKTADDPRAWLHRVGINLANSHFRRRKAERNAKQRLNLR